MCADVTDAALTQIDRGPLPFAALRFVGAGALQARLPRSPAQFVDRHAISASGDTAMKLESLGYGEPFVSAFEADREAGQFPARVISAEREQCVLWCETGVVPAVVGGRLRHEAAHGALPVVGDWVVAHLDPAGELARVQRVLPRRTTLARKRPQQSTPQLIATNIDCVLVVSALNQDFSPRRLERALALVWEAGAEPVVLLTKLDRCPDPNAYLEAARAVALGVPVHALSVPAGYGLEVLDDYLRPARTLAMIGSSGVGKSTLLNHWLGEARAKAAEARSADDKGRHTTSSRELFLLPQGALLIDTPGMRELGLIDAEAGLPAAFTDIEALAPYCRFADCEHAAEPGCAVQAAVQRGELARARYDAYTKLQRELAYEQRRSDERAQHEHQRETRRIQRQRTRSLRSHPKYNGS